MVFTHIYIIWRCVRISFDCERANDSTCFKN